jgi:hypothetical protein
MWEVWFLHFRIVNNNNLFSPNHATSRDGSFSLYLHVLTGVSFPFTDCSKAFDLASREAWSLR